MSRYPHIDTHVKAETIYGKKLWMLYIAPGELLASLSPARYKIIGIPRNRDYDGDGPRNLYFYGTRKGKLLLHVKRAIAYSRESSLDKVRRRLRSQFGIPTDCFKETYGRKRP